MADRTVGVEYRPDGVTIRTKLTVLVPGVAVSFRYDAPLAGGDIVSTLILRHVVGGTTNVSECNSIGRSDVGHATAGDPALALAALGVTQEECYAYLETLL